MAIAYVGAQIGSAAGSGSSLTTGAFTAIGSGHSIVLSGQYASNVTITSVTDNVSGNTYVVQNSGTEWSTFGVYFFIVTGVNITGGPTTFTFNFSGSTNGLAIGLDEFSGVASINAHENYTNIATANPASSVTTTVGDCALMSMIADGVGYTSLPSGYTKGSDNSATIGQTASYLIAGGAAGTKTATWTDGAGGNAVAAVALAPSPAVGTLAVTFADFTLSGTGKVPVAGSLASTFADFTLSGTATVPAAGSLAATIAAFTLVGTGKVIPAASLSEAFGAFTLVGTGTVIPAASLSEAFSNFTLVGTGTVSGGAVSGLLSVTFADFTLAGTGMVQIIAPPPAFAQFSKRDLHNARAWLIQVTANYNTRYLANPNDPDLPALLAIIQQWQTIYTAALPKPLRPRSEATRQGILYAALSKPGSDRGPV